MRLFRSLRSPSGLRRASTAALSIGLLAAGSVQAGEDGAPRFAGPLLSPAPPLPKGALNIEPYFINSRVDAAWDADGNRHRGSVPDQWRLALPIQYGVHERLTLATTLNAYYSRAPGDDRAFDMGDTSVAALFGLYRSQAPSRTSVTLALRQGITTGHHDRLQDRRISVASGNGASTTVLGLHGQTYLLDGRLRARASTSWRVPGATAGVRGLSGFGTPADFDGRVRLGAALESTLAAEYSLSPRWVLVGEVLHERESQTGVHGVVEGAAGPSRLDRLDPGGWRFSVVPAVQYHLSDALAVLFGAQVAVAGRNTSAVVAPQIAINMAF